MSLVKWRRFPKSRTPELWHRAESVPDEEYTYIALCERMFITRDLDSRTLLPQENICPKCLEAMRRDG